MRAKWRGVLLMLLAAVGLVLQLANFPDHASLEEQRGVIHPDVLDTLRTQEQVEVIVHLDAPPLPSPGEIVVSDVLRDTQLRQDAVLSE